jgi:hypothetical protein
MKKLVFLMAILFTISLSSHAAKKKGVTQNKESIMWIDGEANFARFSSPDTIDFYLTKLKSLGFTQVVVDVRPITGEVLMLPVWKNGRVQNEAILIIWAGLSRKVMN